MAKTLDIDLPKMFARYAQTNNLSLVEREFGISRYRVQQLWNALPENEKVGYQSTVKLARDKAIQEHCIEVESQTKNYLQRIDDVRNSLLTKLELCVKSLASDSPTSIARIKDASAALKCLVELKYEDDKDADDIITKLTKSGLLTDGTEN